MSYEQGVLDNYKLKVSFPADYDSEDYIGVSMDDVEDEILFGDDLKQNEIGYLPQQTVTQKDFPASVREIVLSGCQNRLGIRPFYHKEEKKHADEIMEKLQIMQLRKRCYRELSGGQQQRVLLARALCATKKIVLTILVMMLM